MDQRSLTGTKVDPERVDTFVKADAFGDRILGENVIEFGSLHLEGIGLGLIERLGKVEHLRPATPVRHEFCAIFKDADFFDLGQDPEPFEHRHGLREQRFADVESRVRILLENVHTPALIGEESGYCRAGRSSSNDEDVAGGAGLEISRVLIHRH